MLGFLMFSRGSKGNIGRKRFNLESLYHVECIQNLLADLLKLSLLRYFLSKPLNGTLTFQKSFYLFASMKAL